MTAIEFKDFSCYYKYKKRPLTALSHINLTVEKGEFLAIVGESGCGKSTLIKACLGIAEFFDGDLYIDGNGIENVKLKSGQFAYVSQEIGLYPGMTVYENMAFPLRMMRTTQQEVDARVKETAEMMGMRMFLTRKPRQLSIGQQQRVAIGRAIIKNPSFVFFDEPFSNLDPMLRITLRSIVKDIHKKMRPTIIFATHDINEAFMLADKVVVLEKGEIVEVGTPAQLRENAKSSLLKQFFNGEEEQQTQEVENAQQADTQACTTSEVVNKQNQE